MAEIAGRLAAAVRPGDLVARIGGDEFAVLCERLAHADDAERVADRLLDVIRRPVDVPLGNGTRGVEVGASIGVTELGPASRPRGDGLGRPALREAKRLGRGRWVRRPVPG